MLTQYIHAALENARYEWLVESQVYYGEIPALAGVWATGATVEECSEELQEVLEDWIALGRKLAQPLPTLRNGLSTL